MFHQGVGAFIAPLPHCACSSHKLLSSVFYNSSVSHGVPKTLVSTRTRTRQSKIFLHQHPTAVADTPAYDNPLAYRFLERGNTESCVLVGVDVTSTRIAKDTKQTSTRIFDLTSSLDELERLAETAGLTVAATVTQALPMPDPATYIRSGKVSELRETMSSHDCCTAIFDVELTPGQQRSLEEALSDNHSVVKVIDRTALILEIFAQHAATREGQLQVELALYQYRLPRLTRLWTHLGRQGGSGGVGLRGPGETQLEVDRRLINDRVTKLKEELTLVHAHRSRLRNARRRKSGSPVVALIGYTNAGKSTLLNSMTGASALAADALFATLDPTTRLARLHGLKMSPEVLVTDTVGFVQNLPTQLVAAFRATLEEVVEADVLIHVVDGSVTDEVLMWQMQAVDNVLKDIGAGGKPMMIVVNKVDLLEDERVKEVRQFLFNNWDADVVTVSAKSGIGVDDIGAAVEETLRRAMLQVDVLIPYSRGDLTSAIYRQGCVLSEQFVEEGTRLCVRVPGSLWSRLQEFIVASGEVDSNGTSAGGTSNDASISQTSDERIWSDIAKGRRRAVEADDS